MDVSRAYFCFVQKTKLPHFGFLIIVLFLWGCSPPKKKKLSAKTPTNHLIHETSPYLLQHAHNPVHWRPYNKTSLQLAKDQNKLMIISIGYAACHWCHVMEHESFEDSTVAAVMNSHYISIKVDREERPDVDQTYINAVQLMTGSGGWPLNVVTLPDGRPIWGGTYFRKKDWINALEQLQELYEQQPEKMIAYANRLEEGLKSMDLVQLNTEEIEMREFPMEKVLQSLANNFDREYGGFKGAPKFMMPNILEFLLQRSTVEKNDSILEYVTLTLDRMAYGGLYDQIGGGFSRYSTDEKWHVPHFEKMLYDNAQLVSLYSHAYALTKNPLYKQVVEETLKFVSKELTSEEGAFYSSLDADSENAENKLEEGAFYVFSKEELKTLLAADFPLFKEYYNINAYGKWEEDKYVLIRTKSDAHFAKEHNITPEELQKKVENWKKTLLRYRNQRPKPRLDDKTLTSWNALMLTAYIDAYDVFGNAAYLDKALENARFLASRQIKEDGSLYHNYKKGKSNINGFLEDYAFTIQAFVRLYETTMNDQWLQLANELTETAIDLFYDPSHGMFYFTSKDDPAVVVRNLEYRDNVMPASNSVMAKNLYLLSKLLQKEKYSEISLQMLKNLMPEMEQFPSAFSNWLSLMQNVRDKFYEVVVVGRDAEKIIRTINAEYLPQKIVAGSTGEGKGPLFENRHVPQQTLIYVCVDNACQLPVEDIQKAINTIKNN